jgi:mono/diheme cytochrome c family protein
LRSGRARGWWHARARLPLLGVATACLLPAIAGGQAHQPPRIEQDDYVWQHVSNPYNSSDAEAIVKGRRLYRSTCYICHLDAGGRGPDLRKSKLKGQNFLQVVIRGRKGTQMPAWLGKLSEDEMWMILAYLEAPRE